MSRKPARLWTLFAMALLLAWSAAAESAVKKHVEHAKAALLKKDLKTAGRDLRSVGGDLGKAARNSPAAAKEGLESSAREMKVLAGDVGKGTVADAKRIDDASGRAYHALARERFVTATGAWAKKETKATGRALKEAADHLEDGAAVAGKEAGDSAKEVARGTRDVSAKLIQGSGWTAEEIGRGMNSFGKELANLGKRVGSKF